jgi:hypothetical protein
VVGKREVLNEGFEKEGGVKLRGGRCPSKHRVTLGTGRLSLLKLSLRAGWLSRFHYFMEPETEEIVDVGGDDLDEPNLTRKKKYCLPVELCLWIFRGWGGVRGGVPLSEPLHPTPPHPPHSISPRCHRMVWTQSIPTAIGWLRWKMTQRDIDQVDIVHQQWSRL